MTNPTKESSMPSLPHYAIISGMHLSQRDARIVLTLMTEYKMTQDTVTILAYFYCQQDCQTSAQFISKELHYPLEHTYSALERLREKKLLIKSGDCYMMPGIVRDWLSKVPVIPSEHEWTDISYGKELGSYFEDSSLDDARYERLVLILQANPDLQFAQGWRSLGVDALPRHCKKHFLFYCGAFASQWTTPASKPGNSSKNGTAYINDFTKEESKDEGNAENELLNLGLITQEAPTSGKSPGKKDGDSSYRLSAKAARALFRGSSDIISYRTIASYAQVIRHEDILKTQLFYNACDSRYVNLLKSLFRNDALAEAVEKLKSAGINASTCISLSGESGTGKTELVKQLALLSGKDIVSVSLEKISNYLVGETEKAIGGLFEEYDYLHAIHPKPPILLMNEADGFLSKRVEVQNSSDYYVNSTQALLLDKIENFEGELIITTNRADNIDPAMSRRFCLKIDLHCPDAGTRARIWSSRCSWLSPEQSQILGTGFPLTGGGIYNVLKKGILSSVANGKELTFEDLFHLCEDELPLGYTQSMAPSKEMGVSLFNMSKLIKS